MNSHNYNLIWFTILSALFITGCAMWSVPMEQTDVELDITALGLMAIGGVSLAVWLITEPRAVLEAVFMPIMTRLERRRIRRSPFWRRGRCTEEDLQKQILPMLRHCAITIVEAAGIRVCFVSIPNALSSG